ncbi:heterokaryon incompatibility protein-domain-containing protein [Nemania sp. FL0916]|nr:heterokaryon incompatibility protein-domain-containing protein [Nemania sp. FL0916]
MSRISSSTDCHVVSQHCPSTSHDDEVAKVRQELLSLRSGIEELQIELGDVCRDVGGILQDLCRRDSRFLYLQEAVAEFLDGHLGLRDRLSRRTQHIDCALSVEGGHSIKATLMKLEFITQNQEIPERDLNAQFDFRLAAFEILCSAIYEILDVFNLDISVQEASIKYETSAYLDLLHRVYNKTRDLEPNPKKQGLHVFGPDDKSNPNFIYQSKIDVSTDQVRVVELMPGSEDDVIECSLEVRSIKEDGIPEALSYVWGKAVSQEEILVDLQPFSVTKNLLEILRGLRHPKSPRTIWIDAICINQSNHEERNRQVRLMRDIYSQAQHTIIYLTEGDTNLKLKRGEQLVSLPPNFGGITIHQFDLASILREFQGYSLDSPWCERQLALYFMLIRCTHCMLSHSWWERIWTLQEGALPASPPVIHYRNHSCTFDTLQSAIGILYDINQWDSEKYQRIVHAVLRNPNRDAQTDEILNLPEVLRSQGLGSIGQPLLCRLRQTSMQHDRFATGFLSELLQETATYRATNPRDKIYALESLLPRCIGKLFRIDYNESYETLFSYVTARYINSKQTYQIAAAINLLIESTMSNNENSAIIDDEISPIPSWALDFSYCNSSEEMNSLATDATDVVTLNGFLLDTGLKIAKCQGVTLNPMFATPSTLFCDGINIDRIQETGIIAGNKSPNLFIAVYLLASDIQRRLQDPEASRRAHWQMWMDIDKKAVSSLTAFFSLFLDTDKLPRGDGSDFFDVCLKETAGKTYFITDGGLVGIATLPVRQGDILCLLDGVPVYFVLRAVPDLEVDGQDGKSKAAQRHRIVARAAVKELDIPTLKSSVPSRRFQII